MKTAPVCIDVENPDAPYNKTEQCSELDDYEPNDPHDANFHCTDLSYASDEEEATGESVPHPAKERKFIVFESSLDQLIAKIKWKSPKQSEENSSWIYGEGSYRMHG